ncbi:MAG TPA: hypothetical protein VJN88_07750, partial [Ktedonobacterales bacterium]|nr:hypothetical protein [Ktedonobacterales bacterium]
GEYGLYGAGAPGYAPGGAAGAGGIIRDGCIGRERPIERGGGGVPAGAPGGGVTPGGAGVHPAFCCCITGGGGIDAQALG